MIDVDYLRDVIESAAVDGKATWCPQCLQAWPGHSVPEGHVYAAYPWDAHSVTYLNLSPLPPFDPDDTACHCCDDWRRYPDGQRHFGWRWWRNSERQSWCHHDHHRSEVWLG